MASADFTVNGSAVTGAVSVSASSTVTLALSSVTGVRTVSWSIVGNHSSAASNPAITPAGSPSGATATFAMPSGASQGYLIQCVINGGVDENGQAVDTWTRRAIVGVVNTAPSPFVPFVLGELFERDSTHGIVEELNNFTSTGGSGLAVSGSPTTGQVPVWNGSAAVWGNASGGGGTSFPFTYSTTTTDADPGAGTFRGNQATLGNSTQLLFDDLEYGGTTVSSWFAAWDDAISSGKGTVRLQSRADSTKWLEFPITAYTSATGYSKITVTAPARGPGGIATTAGDTTVVFDAGATGTITDAAIDAAAAIALSKLASGTACSVVTRSINSTGALGLTSIANNDEVLMRTSNALTSGKIADANVATGAAIAWSKLATAIGNLSFTGLKSFCFNGEVDNGNSGTADTIDWTAGQVQKSTLTGNVTYTFTAPAGPCFIQLKAIQDGTGGRTVTLPSITWVDGITWSPNTTASSTSILSLYYDGTTYYGYGRSADSRIVTESTTARTFGLTDVGAYIRTTNGSATSLTVPPNSTTAFPIGSLITGIQAGAGQITFVQGSGVTINKPSSRNLKTAETFSTWALKKVNTDEWDLCGDLELA